ncbi:MULTISPECIES: Hsp33 family molecular chaperone HslO [Gammaproteobacteria]|uniref:Hsp33 family molecular chaperone HslO n=1 Tax=Gammaproteobacteria TaxID=1236 RepID=UPI000DD07A2E|nr:MULTISPECIES: Hsp33 family molecular chaperone HslO [Gammaproteobacteria]RTE86207.1 Hsp33 family molecular chaperone HslO [Aliidiomarina sp. B3213]TCZ91559.1 Hsp33 family molecular chaperone HslO [Lysobacter sp. N42]
MSAKANAIHRFTFSDYDVRGEVVQLNKVFSDLCEGHQYPAPVKKLLGELLAMTSLLTATLKFEGHINVTLQGDGPVNYATVNGSHDQSLRGVARVVGEIEQDNLPALIGNDALLIITLTPSQGEQYQGVVKIEDDNLSAAIERYFQQSEQLPTRVWLHADTADMNCGGLFLQVLPGTSQDDSGFEHTVALAATLTAEELFGLDVQAILHRLYHEDELTLYPPQNVQFVCGCSRERTAIALRSIDRNELREIIQEDGELKLTCDYCLTEYVYDAVDVEALDAHETPPQQQ